MTKLQTETLQAAITMATDLYSDSDEDIQEAWKHAAATDEALTVSLTLKFAQNKKRPSVIDVDAAISFIKERVKRANNTEIDQNQERLIP